MNLIPRSNALILLLFFACTCNAQYFSQDYSPIQYSRLETGTLTEIRKSYEETFKSLSISNNKAKQDIRNILTGLGKDITWQDSFLLLMQEDTLTRYLSSIVEQIREKNNITDTYRVFTYRTDVPNASNLGEGVIMVNLDLVARLHSEAELAFVLCHEMAHDLQEHVVKGIVKNREMFYSETFQEELKKLKKQEYNRRAQANTLYSNYLADYTGHKRENEFEADSIGLLLFSKSGYQPQEAVSTIGLLDSIDQVENFAVDFQQYFNFPNYPFKPQWLEFETDHSLGSNLSNYKTPDSLKTHPNCALRAMALNQVILQQQLANATVGGTGKDYLFYRTVARFEVLETLMSEKAYGLALYKALALQKEFPDNIYLKCLVTNCLYELYQAQVQHKFSMSVEFPKRYYPIAYNDFLRFLHNLSNTSLKNICINYCNDRVQPYPKHPYGAYAIALAQSIDIPAEERPELVEAYYGIFGETNYYSLLKNKLNPTQPKNKKK